MTSESTACLLPSTDKRVQSKRKPKQRKGRSKDSTEKSCHMERLLKIKTFKITCYQIPAISSQVVARKSFWTNHLRYKNDTEINSFNLTFFRLRTAHNREREVK